MSAFFTSWPLFWAQATAATAAAAMPRLLGSGPTLRRSIVAVLWRAIPASACGIRCSAGS